MSGAYFALSLNRESRPNLSFGAPWPSWSDRSSLTCGRLGAAVPLPKRISPPVTEVGSSGLTKLLISRENELGLRGSPRGGPSEGRAGNQRDQRESSDKRLHDIPVWTIGLDLCMSAEADRPAPAVVRCLRTLDREKQCLFPPARSADTHLVSAIWE
jgi:hypothetical protein